MPGEDITSKIFLIRESVQSIKEAKRDPLEGIDSLMNVDTMVHGTENMPANKSSNKNFDTSKKKNPGGHSPSDADERTDDIQGSKPTKPDTVKI